MADWAIRPIEPHERERIKAFIAGQWGAPTVVAHGVVYRPHELPGLLAEEEGQLIGLLAYHIEGDACEIVTIDAVVQGSGVGTALLEAVRKAAQAEGCRRLWLITTNDNLDALRFYQRRGFRLVALRPGAVSESRRLKPSIPQVGAYGIPLRDELELELTLPPAPPPDAP